MTLTEFLLARIAEDEATNGCNGEGEYVTCWKRSEPIEAECEAKRAIVALHALVVEKFGGCPHPGCSEAHGPTMPPACQECCTGQAGFGCDTSRLLALPYADHPDYDEAWRL